MEYLITWERGNESVVSDAVRRARVSGGANGAAGLEAPELKLSRLVEAVPSPLLYSGTDPINGSPWASFAAFCCLC